MSKPDAQRGAWEREQRFHDDLSAAPDVAGRPPRAPDALELALLDLAGPIEGRDVLELGCGAGELTMQLLELGARVTALDVSPGMVEVARQRAERYVSKGHSRFVTAPAERTGLPSEAFDLVVGKWILHHVDVPSVADEIARLVRPGGRGVFIENSGLNPLLAFSRRHLVGRFGIPRYGTQDEHPLVDTDYDELRRRFAEVRLHYPYFDFFHIFNRQVLRYRFPAISRFATRLDRMIQQRVPRLRPYSFRVLVEVKAPPPAR